MIDGRDFSSSNLFWIEENLGKGRDLELWYKLNHFNKISNLRIKYQLNKDNNKFCA